MSSTPGPIAVSLDGLHVCLGLPVADRFALATTVSLVDTASALSKLGLPVVYQWQPGVSIVQKARNLVAHEFLKRPACNRLFWIDADMSWNPQDLIRILALSQELPCVGAVGPIKTDEARIAAPGVGSGLDHGTGQGAQTRTGTFFAVNLPPGQTPKREPPFGLIQVSSMGLCFCCVHREVIEKLAHNAPRFRHGDEEVAEIFRCGVVDGEFRGEDRNFFDDVRALGYDVWLDPAVNLAHWGSKAYRGDLLQAVNLAA